MCEKCRLMELLDRELERWEVYHGSKALANALHLYAIERRDRVIAEAREKEDREMYDSPTPPSREERIEKARMEIQNVIDPFITSTRQDDRIRAILTELMEGKP